MYGPFASRLFFSLSEAVGVGWGDMRLLACLQAARISSLGGSFCEFVFSHAFRKRMRKISTFFEKSLKQNAARSNCEDKQFAFREKMVSE